MNYLRPLFLALLSTAFLLASHAAQGGSATWNFNQTTGEWESPENWTPATVPNDPDDVATFAAADRKQVRLSSSVTVSSIVFTPDATAYNITVSGFMTELTIIGPGILNQSGFVQTFVGNNSFSHLTFLGSATAGEQTTFLNKGAISDFGPDESFTLFYDSSSANHATIANLGATGEAAAGGYTKFFDSSTADAATIINNAATGFGMTAGSFFSTMTRPRGVRPSRIMEGNQSSSSRRRPSFTITPARLRARSRRTDLLRATTRERARSFSVTRRPAQRL